MPARAPWQRKWTRAHRGRPRDQAYEMHLLTRAQRPSVAGDSRPNVKGRRSLCVGSQTVAPWPHPGWLPLRLPTKRSRTRRISCEGRTTLPSSAVTGPTMMLRPASNRPSSAASACSTPPGASPRRCRQLFLTGPDRTPDSLRGARRRDPGGCGTGRITEPAKPARLRRPQNWRAATCCPLGRHGTAPGTRAQ